MQKKIFVVFILIVITVAFSEVVLRLVGFRPAHAKEKEHPIAVVPDSFLIKDNHLGWRVGTGVYDTYSGGRFIYKASIDSSHKRIAEPKEKREGKEFYKRKLFILGCSFSFGVGVPDSGVCAYYLQSMLPEYEVQNLAVPAYGLTQMYLSLKQEIQSDNKPDVVVLNYGQWQDERTFHGITWLRRFKYSIIQSAPPEVGGINYPRCNIDKQDGSLIIDKLDWNDWPEDFPLRDKSVLVDLINTAYDNYYDHRTELLRQKTVLRCALEIVAYCEQQRIPILFFGLNQSDHLIDSLINRGIPATTTQVDISQEGWSCAPFGHPSARAHEVYAQEIIDYLKQRRMI